MSRILVPGSRAAWWFLGVSFAALLVVATFASGGPPTDEERIQSLAEQYACPTCKGQSVAESNAAVAVTIREFIRGEVVAGASDTEIRDDLVRAYGGEVLLTPPSEGIGVLVWMLPVVVLAGGGLIVGSAVFASRRPAAIVTADDQRLVDELRRGR